MAKDTRSRKYQLTINNPIEHDFSHDKIKEILFKSNPIYFCLCDEQGQTYHTHIYVCYENAVYFSTIKNRFPTAHIENTRGSSSENRDYIRKEGKYLNSDKKETNIPETFEEWGDLPQDKGTKNESVSEQVLEMVKNGCGNIEIITTFPSYCTKLNQLDTLRQAILNDKYSKEDRVLNVTYIFGDTGSGKTRFVMNSYNYEDICKVSNYEHPFDSYNGQKVLLLDEFRSGFPISDLLQYLDRYPCRLPARYTDKVACYTDVYIISNEDLSEQYINIQNDKPESYQALLRRINKVLYFKKNDIPFDCSDTPIIIEIPLDNYLRGQNDV